MAIEYLEIRDINREIIGVIDTAISVIWHKVWYGVGDFEIYAKATPEHLRLLEAGRYITRPDDDNIGIVEKINISDDPQNGTVITASGRFAKAILERRHIYKLSGHTNTPTILRGNVEQNIRRVVQDNAINCPFDSKRNIGELELGTLSNIPAVILDSEGHAAEKQVSYENLLEYTDEVLQEYGLSAKVYLDTDTIAKKLKYKVEKGADRSIDNTEGLDVVIFSKDYDNLSASVYDFDTTPEKNVALIGGEGEGKDRFYSLLAGSERGLARREYWVDASSISKTLFADDLQSLFPTGTFSGIYFYVGGVIYATLVYDLEREYSLSSLQDTFPQGVVSGTKFTVNGVVFANKVYGDDNNYKLTPLGYKGMLDAEGEKGDYILSDAVYTSLLNTQGKQELAPLVQTEIFNGTINVTAGNYILNRDFFLGDIVTVQENSINKYLNVRITETTEVQDANGYLVEATYE